MTKTGIRRIAWPLLTVALAAVVVAACGSSGGSSEQAQTLLQKAFNARPIHSGTLSVNLGVNPSGSQTITGPLELSLDGPFEAGGSGRAAKSDFTLRLTALGRSGTLGVISTGTRGYVTLQGTSYNLPQSTFRQFESQVAPATNSPHSGLFLKRNLLSWVRNPVVVGNETVAGASTTHIHGTVDVHKMLTDLASVIHSAGSTLGSGLSGSSITNIAGMIRNPTVDVWVGSSDHTLRKLSVHFGVPVSGSISTLFGGLRAARVSLVVQYANINQPQTIKAPSSAKPFSEFVTRMRGLLQGLQGTLTGGAPSTGGGSSSGSGSGQKLQRYTRCIQSAGSDVTKMQRCAAILNGQ